MMDKEQFIEYVLTGGPESTSDKDTAAKNIVRPKGFAGKGFQPKEKKSAEPTNRQSTFAKRLLEAAGFGVPEEVARGTLIRGDDAAARYLPERVFYWPKTSERPYQTLLFEADVTHRELLAIPAFRNRKMDHLDVVEDALARLVQQSLRGFERGGEGVTAAIKKGRQDETLCIVSIVDERDSQPVRLVCFGTMNAKNEGLETFQITEQTRYWEPQLARDYLGLLYQRQFGRLEGSGWQDAFTTTEERKLAQKLLEVCSKSRPKEADIQESVLDLLDEIAKSFGLRRKPGQDRRLQGHQLPPDHDIGIDPDAIGRSSKTANPFQGIAIHDEKNRLLGYIVYCLDQKKDAEELRARLERHNRFHNVLVVYPDGDEAALELWQGNEPLMGKLRKDGAHFRGEGEVVNLLSRFFVVSKSKVRDPEGLAEELAYRARYLRTLAVRQMEAEGEDGPLQKLYHAFRDALIHDQTEEQFADSYAQTLTYGLLTARWVSKDEYAQSGERFTRQNAVDHLHVSHGFLRDFYRSALKATSGQSRLTWLLDDIANLLDRISIDDVFAQKKDADDPWSGDPVIHFYEPFLNKYDAATRQRRGVYYTPRPVVSYIVRSVHELLQTEFSLADGLADTTTWGEMLKKHPGLKLPPLTDEPGEKRTISPDEPFVQILDPATGTATFLVEVIDVIHRTLAAKWKRQHLAEAQQLAAWNDYVPQHLLPRLHAFELMMAPYAIAHMKIGLKLAETGYRFVTEERARIYLTNALEPWTKQMPLIGFDALAHEAAAVNEIKRHKRFTVVIGNPPYSGLSANMSEEAGRIIEPYKYINGVHFGERKHWLHDDYVKFFRFSETRVTASEVGVVGLITNHAFYDNPSFNGMRWNLLKSFDHLRLLDLHGNTMKREKNPDGSEDKNVFDIQQGVAISLFSKLPSKAERVVTHGELWGARERKYAVLSSAQANTLATNPLTPSPTFYFFVPRVEDNAAEYESSLRLNEIFGVFAGGFLTARDHFVIDFDRAELLARIEAFADAAISDAKIRETYFAGCGSDKYPDGDTRGWKVPDARKRLRKDADWKRHVYRCLYRPFDVRWIYWTEGMVDWPRPEVNGHLLNEGNLALVFMRQVASGDGYSHFLVSRLPVDNRACYSNKGIMTFAPLHLHESSARRHGELSFDSTGTRPNFTPAFTAALRARLGNAAAKLTPEDIFHYAYAVFHSPGYRSRYAEFLKIDFPRLPLTGNLELFRALARLGGELTALHLLESPKLAQPITEFIGGRNPSIEKISRSKDTVWVDKAQTTGFQGVREDVWSFRIGGYQVCEKWLKDRKGRTLTKDDIAHYHKIVLALSETIRLMKDIDKVIEKHGGWPGAFAQSSTVKAAK